MSDNEKRLRGYQMYTEGQYGSRKHMDFSIKWAVMEIDRLRRKVQDLEKKLKASKNAV